MANYNTTWVADYAAIIIPVMDVKDSDEAKVEGYSTLCQYLERNATLFKLEQIEEMPEGDCC